MFDLMPWRKRTGSDLVGFKNEIDNLFNRFFELDFPLTREFFREGRWAPRVDVSDSEKQITVKAEIPGCNAADIDISLERRMLTIKGEKKQEKEEKEENYVRVERARGMFSRTIELPTDVDPESVEASYKKGVLTVVLNKIAPSESKKIKIKTN
jgi:HSP20 family protein